MTFDFTTVFTLASIFILLCGIVALMLTAPGAKRSQHNKS